jgi:hypothetical protein
MAKEKIFFFTRANNLITLFTNKFSRNWALLGLGKSARTSNR